MDRWTVAAVQFDCRLGDPTHNLATVRHKLAEQAAAGVNMVVFPECALTGYALPDRAAAVAAAEPIPGPSTNALAADCDRLGVWAVVGVLERDGNRVYNAAALVGPGGRIESYRKVHLPCVGVDRFVDPGDRPFAVHDLGGLRVGLGICFDLSFPEAARVLTLLGADLIVLPTNWAAPAVRMATLVTRVRALENRVYVLACNRVGDEGGYHYLGQSSVCDVSGDFLAVADHDRDGAAVATIDPAAARQKRVVTCAGEYEIDRVNWRRPEFYAALGGR